MKRGEVRWYTFEPPDKRRPVLILTRSSAIRHLTAVTVAPITTTMREIPTEVVLSTADGLFADCAVNLDNIQTIKKSKIGSMISSLSADRMIEVNYALSFALGLDEFLA